MVRKMVYADNAHEAPDEVWLEWSILPDGSNAVLEDDHLSSPDHLRHRPVKYVRAWKQTEQG